jgi:Ni/Fe-hydrogenase subunit HybB-like protein
MSVTDHLHYYPTWMEIALSLGFFTAGTIIFFLAVHFLPIFGSSEEELPESTASESDAEIVPA